MKKRAEIKCTGEIITVVPYTNGFWYEFLGGKGFYRLGRRFHYTELHFIK